MCKCFLRGWSENQIEKHPQQRNEKPCTSEKKNQHLEKSFGEENNFVILLANIVRSADIQLRAPKSRPPDVLIHVNTKAHWEAVTCYLLLSIECLQLQSQPPSNRGGEKRRKSIKSPSGKKKKETSSQKQEVQVIFLLTCQHKTRLTATKCSSLVLTVSYFLLNQEITPVLRGDRSLIIRCNSNWPEQLSLGRGWRAHQNDASWRNAEYQS